MCPPLSYKLLPEFSREIGSSHLFGRSESCAAQASFTIAFLIISPAFSAATEFYYVLIQTQFLLSGVPSSRSASAGWWRPTEPTLVCDVPVASADY